MAAPIAAPGAPGGGVPLPGGATELAETVLVAAAEGRLLFVGAAGGADVACLESHFGAYGDVAWALPLRTAEGSPKGVALVAFAEVTAARAALRAPPAPLPGARREAALARADGPRAAAALVAQAHGVAAVADAMAACGFVPAATAYSHLLPPALRHEGADVAAALFGARAAQQPPPQRVWPQQADHLLAAPTAAQLRRGRGNHAAADVARHAPAAQPKAPPADVASLLLLPTRRLYVGGGGSAAALRAHFVRYGPLRQVYVCRSPCGVPRGFSFVTYEREEDAAAALAHAPHTTPDGRQLIVRAAEERPRRAPPAAAADVAGGAMGAAPMRMAERGADSPPPPPPLPPVRTSAAHRSMPS